MDLLWARFAAFDFFLMLMLPFVGNRHEPAGHESVYDSQKEDQGGDKVEGLFFNTIFQNRPDAYLISIIVALQATRKIAVTGRRRCRRRRDRSFSKEGWAVQRSV